MRLVHGVARSRESGTRKGKEKEGEKVSTNPEEFYKVAVGPKNQDYYLRIFHRFENDGKAGVSWHWPAFFVTFFWLLYRRMWRNALIYFVLANLLIIPLAVLGAMAGGSVGAVISSVNLLYSAATFILPPLYANALYYRHCKEKIEVARASSLDMQRQLGELSGKGGTSSKAPLVPVVVAVIGILAAIALPAYESYKTYAGIKEAISIGNSAAASVARYYSEHRTAPASLQIAGFTASLPPSVKSIAVDSQNGMVVVTMAISPIEGKAVLLLPSLDANGQVTWKCMSQQIPDRYLPQQCRQQDNPPAN